MKTPKILYVSCHSVLEYDELRMFRDLGCSFFSLGAYIDPTHPHVTARPPLENCKGVDAWDAYHKMTAINIRAGHPETWHARLFTPEFLDCFDVIIIMHIPEWILRNWNVMKGRNVIWRTIGQSTPQIENSLKQCKAEGLKIVRYSPNERKIDGFIGEDTLIRFGKYKEDFSPWTGSLRQVISVGQSMKARMDSCNYTVFRKVTSGFPTKLYGFGNDNEDIEIKGGALSSYEDLLKVMSDNSVYFYTGTKPASYTLNFMEAAMSGIPIVSIGPELSVFEGRRCYHEVHTLLAQYGAGIASDHIWELRKGIQWFLDDKSLATDISERARFMASELFDADKIRMQWKEYFNTLC